MELRPPNPPGWPATCPHAFSSVNFGLHSARLGACCPHGSRPPLVGFRHGQFATSGAEAYHSAFCKYLAQFMLSALAAANTGDVSSAEDAEQLSLHLLQGSPTISAALSVALRLLFEDAHKATMALAGGAFYAGAFLRGGLCALIPCKCSLHSCAGIFRVECFPLWESLSIFKRQCVVTLGMRRNPPTCYLRCRHSLAAKCGVNARTAPCHNWCKVCPLGAFCWSSLH